MYIKFKNIQQAETSQDKSSTGATHATHRTRYFNRLGATNAKQPVKFRAEVNYFLKLQ